MADNLPDYELRPSPDQLPPDRPHISKLWILAAALVAAIGAAVYFLKTAPPATPPAQESSANPAAGDPQAPLGNRPMPVTLPPLAQSDELVRKLVSVLSSHPQVTAWLATEDLIRNFTVVVANIADGEPPVVHVSRLRPTSRFQVIERNGDMTIDPRSYERYTPLAAAISALDADGCARLYATLKPLIEEAHRNLGYTTSFDATLERAIVRLLSTPVIGEPVRVVPHGIVYAFEDQRLEKLTPGQKHLLRFGSRNMQAVQQKLREIALAVGIPEDRLPD